MDENNERAKPAWLAPAVVVVIVLVLVMAGKKKRETVENPVIDFAVITVAVFAFASVFRWSALKLGAPGLATFFGSPVQAHPDHTTEVDAA